MRRDDSDRVFGALLPDAPTVVLILLAVATLVFATVQGLVEQLLAGRPADVAAILEWRITPVLIWIAATPVLLAGARVLERAAAGSWRRLLGAHLLLGTAWIVCSNFLMRAPAALRGEPLDRLLADAVRGTVEYGPAAAVVYAGLVVIGRSGWAAGGGGAGTAGSEMPREAGPGHLPVRSGVRIHLLERSDIRWVEADGDHVRIHTDEKAYRTRGTLTAYERELEADGFLRVHRSALVHPRAIREIQPFYHGDHVAILRDGSEIRIPRTREDVLEALLAPTVGG